MLQLKNITKKFPGLTTDLVAVDKLTLEVKSGQVFGFIGLNGAGKTTTLKIVTGLLFADSGQSRWKKLHTNSIAAKNLFGFMPEQPQFHRHLTANEVLQYVGELFAFTPEKITKRSAQLLKKVGLGKNGKTPVKNFSKGMNQRLGFAVALLNDPELLILDEPLDGLDPIGRDEFKKLILEQKKLGKTVFLSSHILADIDEICDQIGVIHQGKLVFTGTPKQLKKNQKSLEAAFVKLINNV